MVRIPLTDLQRDRGRALGQILRTARGTRSAADVAAAAGVSLDTLRKIERGAIASPAFFTVVALARALDVDVAALAGDLMPAAPADATALAS